VLGRNQRYAHIGDIIKAHIKEAAPDGTVKKGEVVDAVVVADSARHPADRWIVFAVRQQRDCDHRQGNESARNAHLRAGGARTARQEVYEDRLAGAGSDLRNQDTDMQRFHVKTNDEVVVLAGADKASVAASSA